MADTVKLIVKGRTGRDILPDGLLLPADVSETAPAIKCTSAVAAAHQTAPATPRRSTLPFHLLFPPTQPSRPPWTI